MHPITLSRLISYIKLILYYIYWRFDLVNMYNFKIFFLNFTQNSITKRPAAPPSIFYKKTHKNDSAYHKSSQPLGNSNRLIEY